MTIRIGASPIAWSNDDLPELGGDTPLETCLAEASEAGFDGIELGDKFPREPDALKAVLGRFGLDLVSGWYSAELLDAAAEEEMPALRPHLDLLKAMGCRRVRLRRDHQRRPRRPREAARRAAAPGAGEWAEFGERMTAVGDAVLARGSAPRLSPSHGHGRRVGGRHRRLHAGDRPLRRICCSTPATRPGAAPIRPRLARRYRARISHVHCKDVRRDVMERARRERLELPRRRPRRHVHRAGRRLRRLSAPSWRSCPAIPAGSWSRPSRIPTRPIRSPMPKQGMQNLRRYLAATPVSTLRTSCPTASRPAVRRRDGRVHPRHAAERRLDLCRLQGLTGCVPAQSVSGETRRREVCLVLIDGRAERAGRR